MATNFEKAILLYEEERIGRFSQVFVHKNRAESLTIPIAVAPASPDRGLSTYATVGLSQHDNGLVTADGTPLRVELLTVGRTEYDLLGRGLANSAFNIASGECRAKPGLVLPGVFEGYGTGLTTPHALLWYPFPWGGRFDGFTRDGVSIQWLLVVAITQQELEFVAAHGPGFHGAGVEKLVDAFENNETDVYDMSRASAV